MLLMWTGGDVLQAQTRVHGLDPNKPAHQYVISNWQAQQGLPQNTAYCFLQTRDGYLWIGGYEGLSRFDGARFVVFNKQKGELKSTNWVTALHEDRFGTLWVATDGGGLQRRHQDGRWKYYALADGLPSIDLTSLTEDREGNIWVGTIAGLCYVHAEEAHPSHFNRPLSPARKVISCETLAASQTPRVIESLVCDSTGTLWAASPTQGLFYRTARQKQWQQITTQEGLPTLRLTKLHLDRTGSLWIGTANAGVCKIRLPENGTPHTQRLRVEHLIPAKGFANTYITDILCDREGTLWIATTNKGALRGREDTGLLPPLTLQSDSTFQVFALADDNEGSLWIGTRAYGIYRLRNGFVSSMTTKGGLLDNVVASVHQAPNGAIWARTWKGWNVYTNGRWQHYKYASLTSGEVFTYVNWSLGAYSDQQGRTWMFWRKRLHGVEPDDKHLRMRRFLYAEKLPPLLLCASHTNIIGLHISTPDSLCLYAIRVQGLDSVVLYNKYGLPQSSASSIKYDSKGTLWILTYEHGLYAIADYERLDANSTILHYDTTNGLPASNLWTMLEDTTSGARTYWIGTNNGLARLQNGKFTTYTTKQGMFDDVAFSIVDDGVGYLWMGCNRGIYRVSKRELHEYADGKRERVHCKAWGIPDGMSITECIDTEQGAWAMQDGTLWFATASGIAKVNPRAVYTNPIVPTVLVEEVVADSSIAPNGAVLAATTQNLEIHYTATSLAVPERVRFKYMLEGYDAVWVDAGTRRTAYYTNLPRGRAYRFRVIACNNDGLWNEAGAMTTFRIELFWWETLWFQGLCGIGLAAVVYEGFRWRTRRLRARAAELEHTVNLRTQEVQRQSQELQQQATAIQLANVELGEKNAALNAALQQLQQTQAQLVLSEKMAAAGQLTAGVMHEINNPNAALYSALQELLKEHATIQEYFFSLLDDEARQSPAVRTFERMIDSMQDTTKIALIGSERIKAIVGQLRHFTRFQREAVTTSLVAEEMANTIAIFRLQFRDVRVRCEVEEGLVLTARWGEMNQVMLNLLVNAAQARAFEITVTGSRRNACVVLRVADNGEGMSEETRTRVFEPFFTTKPVGQGTGLGMAIAYGIIERHGGSITIDSAQGKGTAITITLPNG